MKNTTPGPWRWGDWSATFGTREQHRDSLEYSPTHKDDPTPVIRTPSDTITRVLKVEDRDEMSDDDAELIRRAPELRDALAEMLRDFGGNMDSARFRELRALVGDPVEE